MVTMAKPFWSFSSMRFCQPRDWATEWDRLSTVSGPAAEPGSEAVVKFV